MKISKIDKLLKKYTANELLTMYMENKIFLTDRQLDKVCEKSVHHGACYLGGKK